MDQCDCVGELKRDSVGENAPEGQVCVDTPKEEVSSDVVKW